VWRIRSCRWTWFHERKLCGRVGVFGLECWREFLLFLLFLLLGWIVLGLDFVRFAATADELLLIFCSLVVIV